MSKLNDVVTAQWIDLRDLLSDTVRGYDAGNIDLLADMLFESGVRVVDGALLSAISNCTNVAMNELQHGDSDPDIVLINNFLSTFAEDATHG